MPVNGNEVTLRPPWAENCLKRPSNVVAHMDNDDFSINL
ncbi:hypothetical protein WM42_0179 [Corynebacterium simulans]|uniref:Uncharacterized protein n=1 Tax=Corynebacterium simulans TaxID=146827 RepID=A0ABR5VAN7_9CORY|nr:hypothetical protein WM42_0179 [Corynebacterium simulans]KXU18120.1 hypothetical protein WM41_1137 [Corynebacterium simulans]